MVQKVLRLSRVLEITGKGKSQIYSEIALNVFPKPILLGKRAVGWLESEIAAWQQARIAERDRAGQPHSLAKASTTTTTKPTSSPVV